MNNLSMPHIKITRRDLLVMISEEVHGNSAITSEDRKNFGRMLGELLLHPVISSPDSTDFTAALKAFQPCAVSHGPNLQERATWERSF